ncbi:hypothetical protein [Devosia sp.]|uniref:hypothetical protein n=1 Tax=Devosia sp. TaxID=1871048 RepID=UPI003A8F3DAC
MSARIAPDPVGPAFGTTADFSSRTLRGDAQLTERTAVSAAKSTDEASASPAVESLPEVPPPASPPGEAFAVALISGQLPPRPASEREVQLRLGSAEPPAQSALPLMDKLI